MSEPLDIVEVLRRPLETISQCRRMRYVTAEVAEIAATEIARLREERLTNEERGAISWATAALLNDAEKTWPAFRERSKHSREAAETLKGLLERHKND